MLFKSCTAWRSLSCWSPKSRRTSDAEGDGVAQAGRWSRPGRSSTSTASWSAIAAPNGRVAQLLIYVALGVNLEGKKELLGLWLGQNEGAKFWLSCLTDLKNRGLSDIFVACVDGLAGFPEAIRAAYPQTTVQLCIVHLVRAALRHTSNTQDSQGGDAPI